MKTARVVDPVEGHRLWAPSYDQTPNPVVALEERTVMPLLGPIARETVVDVACGTGRWMRLAAQLGAKVFGFDVTRAMLQEAESKTPLRRRLVQADANGLPVSSQCADIVLCAFGLGYAGSVRPVLAELVRIAKPGGRVIVTDFHPEPVRRGWTRGFSLQGDSFVIRSRPYTVEEVMQTGQRLGLQLLETREPRFEEPERPLFEQAGKANTFEQARHFPAVMIVVWRVKQAPINFDRGMRPGAARL